MLKQNENKIVKHEYSIFIADDIKIFGNCNPVRIGARFVAVVKYSHTFRFLTLV